MVRPIVNNIVLTTEQFQQMLAADQGNGQNNNNNNHPNSCSYKEFANCKPPSFKGNEEAVELTRWFKKLESIFRICNCGDDDRVKYAASSLSGIALTWWNAYVQTTGIDNANAIPWAEFKSMMVNKFCPRGQIQKLEIEFWELKVKGTDIESYTNRFLELATLCPGMCPTEERKIERYVEGLPEDVQGNVIAAGKETIDAVILMAQSLMMAKKRRTSANKQVESKGNESKRKFEPSQGSSQNDSKSTKSGYKGTYPFCIRCEKHHHGRCTATCTLCNKVGHVANTCRSASKDKAVVPTRPPPTCYTCGEKGHISPDCPKKKNTPATGANTTKAKGRAFVMTAEEEREEEE